MDHSWSTLIRARGLSRSLWTSNLWNSSHPSAFKPRARGWLDPQAFGTEPHNQALFVYLGNEPESSTLRSMVFRTTLRASTCALLLALAMGCDQDSDEPTPNPRAESPATAPTDSGPKTNSGSKTTPAAKEAAPSSVPAVVEATGPACLPGTWHYDFSDKSLETMMSNVEGAKVTKKEGELLCDISVTDGGGAMKCSVKGGKPFVVEVAATQPGLPPMVINFEATGSTTSKFRLLTDK